MEKHNLNTIFRRILPIVPIFIGTLLFYACKPEKVELCDQYKEYFGDIKFEMSKQDSIDSYNYFQYMKKIVTQNNAPFGGDPYSFYNLYLMNRTDTAFAMEIKREYYSDKSNYNKKYDIDYYLARYIIDSDAVVSGEVVSKDNYSDSCLFYTTTYIIRVDSVICSYFPISKGDKVIIRTNNFGYEGGCKTGDEKRVFTESSHAYDYKENEFSVFFISKSIYIEQFNNFIFNNPKYFDEFCYNSFIAPNNNKLNGLFEKSNPNSLLKFVRNIQKN